VDALLALAIRSGRILRVSLPDGQVDTLLDGAGSSPDGIVVESGVVYWTTMGDPVVSSSTTGEVVRDWSAANGGVHAVGLDGTGKRDVVPVGAITTGKQLASDGAGTLYLCDREGCRVSRVGVDGSGLTNLVVNISDGSWTQECVGIAVDPVRGHLYWTQKGPAKGDKGRILRAGIDVPDGETAEHRSDIEVLWDGLPEPIDLHLDGAWLYWTDRGAPPAGNTLNRAPRPAAGEPGVAPEILAGGFQEAIGLTVDDTGGVAYVSDLGGHIWVVPLPGGPAGEKGPRVLVAVGEPVTGLTGL
jgi:hypothetical protein